MNEEEREKMEKELGEMLDAGQQGTKKRMAMNVLAAAIPYVGGALSAVASAQSEEEQARINDILRAWLKLQEDEMREIGQTMFEVLQRVDLQDETVRKRVESPEYIKIVKKCFRDWAAAESEEKRKLVRNLLSNAAGTRVSTDDVVRQFVIWIERYSEGHFAVMREIWKSPGITRGGIWEMVGQKEVREDSPEADLFKSIISDLSLGHVIRQHREKDYEGNFLKATPRPRTRGSADSRMTSAFEDGKPYELTELGKQFVHYTMNEIVTRITEKAGPDGQPAEHAKVINPA